MTRAYGYTAYGSADNEAFFDRAEETPGPSEVLIDVRAAGVVPADWKFRDGFAGTDQPLPQTLGLEASGIVREIGQDVDGIGVGDEVFGSTASGHGALAATAVLDGNLTARKPPQVGFDAAAVIPVSGGTAFDAMSQLGLTAGQTLLINGIGGGVGVLVAQLARDAGVAVFGVASASKRALVESLDAVAIDYRDDPVARIRELLPGGVDAILDLVGGDALRTVAILITDPARIVSTADPETVEHLGGSPVRRSYTRQTLETVAELMAAGKLDPRISETYPLGQAPEAMRAVESGHGLGSVVVDLRQTDEV